MENLKLEPQVEIDVDEEVGVTVPPAKIQLPTLNNQAVSQQDSNLLGKLNESAGKLAEIKPSPPEPKPKPVQKQKPVIHERRRNWFD